MVTQLRRVGVRRVLWVIAIGGGTFAGLRIWNRRSAAIAAEPPEWPPIEPLNRPAGDSALPSPLASEPVADAPTPAPPEPPVVAPATDDGPLVWVAADGGACPDSHPIKANEKSGIFHVPGGRFYDRTGAQRCYALAEDAEADGYRRAKT